jgi:hypothetical protein
VSTDQEALLDTLIERWQEVADAYRDDEHDDDIARRYRDYRHIYLRNIADLRHILAVGQIPCSLMNDEERSRGDCGDCGRIHDDADDKHGRPLSETATADDPWAAIHPAEARMDAMGRVLVGHLAEALIDSKGEEVRTWARSITHELRRAGIDLRDAIGARLTEIALGRLDEEIPF